MATETQQEAYSIGEDIQQQYVQSRRAAKWLPFFLPHLEQGQSLLDCGCGTGSITLDLAELVAPGTVVGVDRDQRQLDIARANAIGRGLTNVTFEQGNIYGLRFDDNTFDRVLAHTVLFHLSDQVSALQEMRRVVKPQGIVAVADDDYGNVYYSPEHPLARQGIDLWTRVLMHNGASPFYSRHLRGLMLQAGFTRTEGHAVSAEYYGNAEQTRWFAPLMGGVFRNPDVAAVILAQGWATQTELDEISNHFFQWGERPDAFFAFMYCAALGWK